MTRATATVQINVLAAGSLPAWRAGAAVNQWIELPSARPSILGKVSYASVGNGNWIDSWCGLSLDPDNDVVYALANGGHMDYGGNEVNALDLRVASPAWVTRTPCTAQAQFPTASGAYAYYPDGKPGSVHSYYSQQFVKQRGRAMRFGSLALYTTGTNSTSDVNGWNPATNTWDAAGTWTDVTNIGTEHAVCSNPDTGDVYVGYYNAAIYKWAQATGAWSTVCTNTGGIDFNNAASAYDTTRNRILYVGRIAGWNRLWPGTVGAACSDPGMGGPAYADMTTNFDGGEGMVYVPATDSYYLRRGQAGGPKVYRINAATFEVTAVPVSGGASIPGTPRASRGNVFNRWLYSPNLGGCVYVPAYDASAWFIRLV